MWTLDLLMGHPSKVDHILNMLHFSRRFFKKTILPSLHLYCIFSRFHFGTHEFPSISCVFVTLLTHFSANSHHLRFQVLNVIAWWTRYLSVEIWWLENLALNDCDVFVISIYCVAISKSFYLGPWCFYLRPWCVCW